MTLSLSLPLERAPVPRAARARAARRRAAPATERLASSREEEVEIHRLLERARRCARCRARSCTAGSAVRSRRAPRSAKVDEDREADEQHGERDERAGAAGLPGTCSHQQRPQSAFFMSSTITVAASQAAISEAKYSRSRRSITPLAIDREVRQERQRGDRVDQRLRRPALRTQRAPARNPDSRNTKQTTAVRMKAITWLRVAAEMQEPIARKPPAISKLPM